FWYQQPQPAMTVLAPPVFCYWWALAIRLLGDNPANWKLLLLPWFALFATVVRVLTERVARPLESEVFWLIVLSPAVLPGINFMLDFPALTLSLVALGVLLSALELGSIGLAIRSGVWAGLAMQTKYTALLCPAVLLLAAWHGPPARRGHNLRLGFVAVGTAVALFAAWELFVFARYGQSHFLYHLAAGRAAWADKLSLFWPLFGLLG